MRYKVAALYKFVSLPDYAAVQARLKDVGKDLDIRGTLLLAEEGINGTIAGLPSQIDSFLMQMRADPRFADIDIKFSLSEEQPFLRYKVRLKSEIVTLGMSDVDPTTEVGTYVDPADWNDVVSDPDTVVIDTRNAYEIGVGTFQNAIDPNTNSFREFPKWVDRNRESLEGKRIAMFCTGGIRCEKASSYMLSEGFEEVLHLKGGILKYLETQPETTSLWDGDCFVFDQRVAVGHGLAPTDWQQCFACRTPLSAADRRSDTYAIGVSCPHCHEVNTDKERFEERQKQIELAKNRGETHIGQKA